MNKQGKLITLHLVNINSPCAHKATQILCGVSFSDGKNAYSLKSVIGKKKNIFYSPVSSVMAPFVLLYVIVAAKNNTLSVANAFNSTRTRGMADMVECSWDILPHVLDYKSAKSIKCGEIKLNTWNCCKKHNSFHLSSQLVSFHLVCSSCLKTEAIKRFVM